MKKIKFLSRKLKTFTFNDIFLLAETPKEELQEKLNKLVKENVLKKTAQCYIYCEFDYIPEPIVQTVKKESVTIEKNDDFAKFAQKDYGNMKSLTLEELNEIPEYNRKKYIKFFGIIYYKIN